MPRAFYVTNTLHSLRLLNSIYQSLVRLYYGGKVHPDNSDIILSNRSSQCTHGGDYKTRGISLDLPFARSQTCRSCESECVINLNETIANYEVILRPSTCETYLNSWRNETILKSARLLELSYFMYPIWGNWLFQCSDHLGWFHSIDFGIECYFAHL